jgi:hypothetical protein
LVEGAVRAVAVVVVDVGREDSFEVAAVEDQEPIEARMADAADPAFGEGVRSGCTNPPAQGVTRAVRMLAKSKG